MQIDIHDREEQPLTRVQQAMNYHFEPEVLTSDYKWDCPKGCGHAEVSKTTDVTTAPVVLWISLKRWSWSERQQEDICQWTHDVEPDANILVFEKRYTLVSFVVHHGNSTRRGHYTACCRLETPSGSEWYHKDDDIVTAMAGPQNREVWKTQGGDSKIYMLWYVQVDKLKKLYPTAWKLLQKMQSKTLPAHC